MGVFAWVTLATNDSYSLGALVLAHSLKQAGTAHQLAVLVTPGVTNAMREKLATVFNVVQEVNILDSRDEANLRLLKRPELGITFTKLHCWRLTQYEKCVFLDADTLVLQNSDELFEREEFSAAPDVGWPDCFNSGVFVYRPSLDTYEKLIKFALEKGSFDGGDQGLLNLYFSDWAHKDISKHLPFIYNMCSTACYSYLPAFKQFGANAKIIHFIGAQKPWLQYFNTETKRVQPSGDSSHLQEVLQRWWDIFCSLIHPHLSPAMAGLAGAFSQLTLGVARTAEQDALENVLRKQAWEVGNIDYLGRDSFANIWSKITETLSSASPQPPASAPAPEPQVPSAPAQSQSETAPQAEAPVQPSTTPVEPPTEIKPSADVPKADSEESSLPVEAPKKTEQAKAADAAPQTAEVAATESAPVAPVAAPEPVAEVPQEPVAEKPAEKEPIAETTACPLHPKESAPQEVKAPEPQAPSEPITCPLLPKESAPQETKAPETPKATEPAACPLPAKESIRQETKAPEAPSEPQATSAPQTPSEPQAAPEPQPVQSQTPAVESAKPKPEPPAQPTEIAATPAQPTAASVPVEPPVVPAASARVESPAVPAPVTPKSPEPEKAAPESTSATTEPLKAEAPKTAAPVEASSATEPPKAAPEPETPKAAAPVEAAASSPETKVTEATPPATPATPPIEKTKQALAAEASIPATPPPSEGGSTPTPPPRKTDKPKKAAAKSKK